MQRLLGLRPPLWLQVEDPFGGAHAELLHLGNETVQPSGVADPLLHEMRMLGAHSNADGLAGHFSSPSQIGAMQAWRLCDAAAVFLAAAPVNLDEISSPEEAQFADSSLKRGIALAIAAEWGRF